MHKNKRVELSIHASPKKLESKYTLSGQSSGKTSNIIKTDQTKAPPVETIKKSSNQAKSVKSSIQAKSVKSSNQAKSVKSSNQAKSVKSSIQAKSVKQKSKAMEKKTIQELLPMPDQVVEIPIPDQIVEIPMPDQVIPIPEPIVGHVKILYNHYNQIFPIRDGVLDMQVVDEKYCFSFVFKGNYTFTLESSSNPDDPVVYSKESRTCFVDLEDGKTYRVSVNADPEEELRKEKTTYKAPTITTTAKNNVRVMNDLTNQLKGLTHEELMEKGEKYQELIEARELEAVLYS